MIDDCFVWIMWTQILSVVFGIVGLLGYRLLYAFHLLDIVTRFDILQSVVKSVTKNMAALSLTVCLVVSLLGEWGWRDFDHSQCKSRQDWWFAETAVLGTVLASLDHRWCSGLLSCTCSASSSSSSSMTTT